MGHGQCREDCLRPIVSYNIYFFHWCTITRADFHPRQQSVAISPHTSHFFCHRSLQTPRVGQLFVPPEQIPLSCEAVREGEGVGVGGGSWERLLLYHVLSAIRVIVSQQAPSPRKQYVSPLRLSSSAFVPLPLRV